MSQPAAPGIRSRGGDREPAADRGHLLERFDGVRSFSLVLCEPLEPEVMNIAVTQEDSRSRTQTAICSRTAIHFLFRRSSRSKCALTFALNK